MRRVGYVSLALALVVLPAAAADAPQSTIEFPCTKNLTDGRVLVDGTAWDAKMHALGYKLPEGAYVPYEVQSFKRQKIQDATWAEGLCQMKLLPVAR